MPGRKAPEEHRRKDILRAAYEVAVRHGIESLTVRAVAARAAVSHGTVLFHFDRRDALVQALLERVLEATTVLRIPDEVDRLTAAERMRTLLGAEMERLSRDPRHFRLFLEYWALGVRDAVIRKRVVGALDGYRRAFRDVGDALGQGARAARRSPGSETAHAISKVATDGLAGVAVSLVHGCALQAVIDPKNFSIRRHVEAASGLVDGVGVSKRRTPSRQRRVVQQ
jgi:TetR/AcrR family transcriptional regulator, transcriptional repressor of bet genes